MIIVNSSHFGLEDNFYTLKKEVIELNEVLINSNQLIGSIYSDIKEVPEDLAALRSKGALNLSKINMNRIVISTIDDIERSKAPNMRIQTDPTARFAGIGMTSGVLDKHSIKLKALRRELSYKENFPSQLLAEFGTHFFFDELKIPKSKYYHFLEYCNPLGIEVLYKQGKTLQVIQILKQEHKTYLTLLNSDN